METQLINFAETLNQIIAQYSSMYENIGIRFTDTLVSVGEILRGQDPVWDLDLGEPTEDLLDGLVVLDATASNVLKLCKNYYSDYVAIVGGYSALQGQDVGEIILEEPVVLWVAKREEIEF